MLQIVSTNNLQGQHKLESKLGTRFSVTVFLSYYNTIRMTVSDPMDNLFLGTTKHILRIWKSLGYLKKNKLDMIQEKSHQLVVTHDIEKIQRKILYCFDGFDADEYKNWVMLFSMYVLDNVIPKRNK